MHLPNQDYQICIRQEEGIYNYWYLVIFKRAKWYCLSSCFEVLLSACYFSGYCCIRYRVCDTPRSYTLSNDHADMTEADLGSQCTNDYITIEGYY